MGQRRWAQKEVNNLFPRLKKKKKRVKSLLFCPLRGLALEVG